MNNKDTSLITFGIACINVNLMAIFIAIITLGTK